MSAVITNEDKRLSYLRVLSNAPEDLVLGR